MPLFERTGKSVRLTEVGRQFAREVEAILERLEEVVAATKASARQGTREIRIGYSPSLTVKILPQVLQGFRSSNPDVKVQLLDLGTADMLERLRNKTLQAAFLVYPGKPALHGLRFWEIEQHPAGVLLPLDHPLSGKRRVEVKELDDEEVISLTKEDYPEYGLWLADVFASSGKRPRVAEEHDSINSLITAVEAGRGIAFGGRGIKNIIGDRIKVIPLGRTAPPISVGVACGLANKDPVVGNFLKAVHDMIKI